MGGASSIMTFDRMRDTTATVKKVVRKGRRLVVDAKGKELKVKISRSRTAVKINGKNAKRAALKVGMACEISWPKVNSEAKEVSCTNK